MFTLALLMLASPASAQHCYWNDGCAYQLFASKTPYDTVRGDIRDFPIPQNCQAVSLWSIYRHGNRNPGSSGTVSMRAVANLKDEIISSHDAGRGQLCAQDLENLRKWLWNSTLDVSSSELTGIGYEELFNIGKRLRDKYPHLLNGTQEDYYLRTTNTQRSVTSSMAFVHGLTEGTNLNLTVDGPYEEDLLIRPYESCDRYQQEVRDGPLLEQQLQAYFDSHEYVQVIYNVQTRLGLSTQLSADDVYYIYEICRFYRSWEPDMRSPWCAAFNDSDLEVLEYRDDVRQYYRNGHGSTININLGRIVLKDLYDRFNSTVQGRGQKMVAYFSHNAMMEMMAAAMNLFLDREEVIQGSHRDPNRQWRSSFVGCFSTSIVAVLNSCEEPTGQEYRVQIFFNEKVTDICPVEGCTWQQFRDIFEVNTLATLEFCSMEPKEGAGPNLPGSGAVNGLTGWMLAVGLLAVWS